MANIQIRKFHEKDAQAVKEIFMLGMKEHVPSSFMHVLKQPLTQMVLMVVVCGLLTSSKSFLLPILAATLFLAAVRQFVSYVFNGYVDTCLKNDLANISEVYLRNKNTCFWVAESDGRVVGTVACRPAENAPDCLELKRLSVCHSHRGMGIAKALCQTVASFTRESGYMAVFLQTSVVQTDAQKLYEHLGYRKIKECAFPTFVAQVINFSVFDYRLDLYKGQNENVYM